MANNLIWHKTSVAVSEREGRNKHKGIVLWYTGLSGAGKSTLANAVDRVLFDHGCHTFVLDGDNIRHGLNSDLGFGDKDRTENIRRIGEVAKLFVEGGIIVSAAFISPFVSDRLMLRNLLKDRFIEIFVDAPIEICEQRDPKGLYLKAKSGIIPNFTGVSSAYEPPLKPEIIVNTANSSLEQCVKQVIEFLQINNLMIKVKNGS